MSRRTQAATADLVHRLTNIRTLWFVVNNDADHTMAELGPEFWDLVGKLLEGWSLEKLPYHFINREKVLAYAKEV